MCSVYEGGALRELFSPQWSFFEKEKKRKRKRKKKKNTPPPSSNQAFFPQYCWKKNVYSSLIESGFCLPKSESPSLFYLIWYLCSYIYLSIYLCSPSIGKYWIFNCRVCIMYYVHVQGRWWWWWWWLFFFWLKKNHCSLDQPLFLGRNSYGLSPPPTQHPSSPKLTKSLSHPSIHPSTLYIGDRQQIAPIQAVCM